MWLDFFFAFCKFCIKNHTFLKMLHKQNQAFYWSFCITV
nr:MAG TPA: hypothetical protein [Inoviridae sp.]